MITGLTYRLRIIPSVWAIWAVWTEWQSFASAGCFRTLRTQELQNIVTHIYKLPKPIFNQTNDIVSLKKYGRGSKAVCNIQQEANQHNKMHSLSTVIQKWSRKNLMPYAENQQCIHKTNASSTVWRNSLPKAVMSDLTVITGRYKNRLKSALYGRVFYLQWHIMWSAQTCDSSLIVK